MGFIILYYQNQLHVKMKKKKKKKNLDITLQVPSQPLQANQGQPCVSGIE